MFNTEPSNIGLLQAEDKTEKIVPGRDPLYDEIVTAESAERYGLTTSEYRKRDLLGRSCPFKAGNRQVKQTYYECHESIM